MLIALLLSSVTAAHAEDTGLLPSLISAPMFLRVSISGKEVMLDSYVIRPGRPGRFPLVIIVHETPSEGEALSRELAGRSPITFNGRPLPWLTWLRHHWRARPRRPPDPGDHPHPFNCIMD